MSDQRPIIGHIRFSYYGLTDTRLQPDEEDKALARLYDETRIARRFHLFERLTLPSLMAQTDQDFRIIVMSSEIMPDAFKERLWLVASRLPQATVVFSRTRRSIYAYQRHMEDALGPDRSGTAVHFRLDDDDALATSFIARLRNASQGMPPRMHFSFPKGVLLFPMSATGSEGASIMVNHYLTALGLAWISDADFLRPPFAMMHQKLWMQWPVLSDPGFPAYIRAMHFDNDTRFRQNGFLKQHRANRFGPAADKHAAEVEAALADGFPFIDRQRLDAMIDELANIHTLADLPPAD